MRRHALLEKTFIGTAGVSLGDTSLPATSCKEAYNKIVPAIIGAGGRGIPSIINCDFGRVAISICYDLNFDELRFRYMKEKPDLIIISSMDHGEVGQSIWAYSCRANFVRVKEILSNNRQLGFIINKMADKSIR
jgi:hypothetical protein